MDNFYRLAYTLSTHMRNVKMIYGSTFLEHLIDFKLVGNMQKSDKLEYSKSIQGNERAFLRVFDKYF